MRIQDEEQGRPGWSRVDERGGDADQGSGDPHQEEEQAEDAPRVGSAESAG
jgi:hypothetical protein